MNYCGHCGKKLDPEAKFCGHCGKSVTTSESEKKDISRQKEMVFEDSHGEKEFAGFWIRFGAYLIDLLGIFIVAFILGVIAYALFDEQVVDEIPEFLWGYFSYVIYSAAALMIWSTTLGKYLYGLKVENESGEVISPFQAILRSLLQPLSTLLFGIGYWKMDQKPNKQAWHDGAAKTVVTRRKKNLVLAYLFTTIGVISWIVITAATSSY